MARIQFAAMVEEILGKLAGSVFQDSYLGTQIRGWSKPRNPQTQLSQLRRGDFRFLSSSWRFLTSLEKQTWIDFAGTVPEAFRLFIGRNINLILINEASITFYIPEDTPTGLPLSIVQVNNTVFTIIASTSVTVVPADCKLLLFATTDKFPTKIFDNPSQYEPIAVFDGGTDFSSPVDVVLSWQAKYGQMRENRRICIKTAVIDMFNGDRSEEFISCANTALIGDLLINSVTYDAIAIQYKLFATKTDDGDLWQVQQLQTDFVPPGSPLPGTFSYSNDRGTFSFGSIESDLPAFPPFAASPIATWHCGWQLVITNISTSAVMYSQIFDYISP